jgi:hypothetical protein
MLTKITLFLILGVLCFSESVEIGLDDVKVIQDTTGLTRVLFTVNLEGILETSVIDFAELFVPSFLPANVVFSLEARRITKDWDVNTVTWFHPWMNSGGDFDTTACCLFTLNGTNVEARHLDVTQIIQRMLDNEENFGILLKRPMSEGDGFMQYGSQLVEKLTEAKIVILYHNDN